MIKISEITAECLTCDMLYTKDVEEYEKAVQQIIFLGIRYYKTGWNSDRDIIYYKVE